MISYEQKVWGRVAHLEAGRTGLSLLELEALACCSKHYHEKRINRFHCLDARILVRIYHGDISESIYHVGPRETFDVEAGIIHRFDVLECGRAVEVYWNADGTDVDMNDIVRLEEGRLLS